MPRKKPTRSKAKYRHPEVIAHYRGGEPLTKFSRTGDDLHIHVLRKDGAIAMAIAIDERPEEPQTLMLLPTEAQGIVISLGAVATIAAHLDEITTIPIQDESK